MNSVKQQIANEYRVAGVVPESGDEFLYDTRRARVVGGPFSIGGGVKNAVALNDYVQRNGVDGRPFAVVDARGVFLPLEPVGPCPECGSPHMGAEWGPDDDGSGRCPTCGTL